MTACLILLGALIVVGLVLRLFHRPDAEPASAETHDRAESEDCCGLHEICEKINVGRLAPAEYYDDEELDRFSGQSADSYTPEEVDEFREVLLSLLPSDVAGWGNSLEKRGINLPLSLRDEYILLLTEK